MKFWRRRFRKRLSERVFDFRHSRQDCARATTFHCRLRKYAINFCLCSPRGNANTRGDFAGVIRKCRGIPRALCCLFPFLFPSPLFRRRPLSLSFTLPLLSISFPLKLSVSFQMFRSIFLPPPLPHSTRALAFRGDVYAHVHTRCARCTRLARVSGVRISGRIHTNTHANSHVDEGTRMVERGGAKLSPSIRVAHPDEPMVLLCIAFFAS